MDIERANAGRWHFSLGAVEKWVVGIVAAGFVAGCYWFATNLLDELREQKRISAEQSATLNTLSVQQAVTNSELSSLRQQLADVPGISNRLARAEVQIQANADQIRELRQMRGLK